MKKGEQVAREIRRAIAQTRLRPGEILPSEARLMSVYGMSRPCIREAMRVLEAEQLITVSRGARGGATINGPTITSTVICMDLALQAHRASLSQLYEMRLVLEPVAARQAAEAVMRRRSRN